MFLKFMLPAAERAVFQIEKSLDETLQDISMTLEKESWTIDVVRRQFVRTAIEQLDESSTEDWQRQLKVKFVGEEGIDIGGLTREFFSLLFTNEELFEHNGFHFDSQMMRKRIYFLLGKAIAMALLSGHPGPQCFHKYIAEYICTGQIPNMGDITEKDIGRADLVSVIEKLKTCDNTKFGELNAEDMLEASGFRKVLTDRNRTEAINALHEHFAFYRHLGPLTQYIEGLQLHSVLKAFRQQAVLKDTIKRSFYKANSLWQWKWANSSGHIFRERE